VAAHSDLVDPPSTRKPLTLLCSADALPQPFAGYLAISGRIEVIGKRAQPTYQLEEQKYFGPKTPTPTIDVPEEFSRLPHLETASAKTRRSPVWAPAIHLLIKSG